MTEDDDFPFIISRVAYSSENICILWFVSRTSRLKGKSRQVYLYSTAQLNMTQCRDKLHTDYCDDMRWKSDPFP